MSSAEAHAEPLEPSPGPSARRGGIAASSPRSASSRPRSSASSSRLAAFERVAAEILERARDDDPHGRPRLLRQRRFVRRVRVRAPAGLDGAARLDLADRLLRRRAGHGRARPCSRSRSPAGRPTSSTTSSGRERSGAFTVAITNDPGSALAAAADAVLPLEAGPEQAVAATKTYTNQVAALGLLAAHTAGQGARFAEELRAVAETMRDARPGAARADHERRRLLLVRREDVRRRPRSRVRDGARDRAQAPRDLPRRRRAADRDRPRPRPGRRARRRSSRSG